MYTFAQLIERGRFVAAVDCPQSRAGRFTETETGHYALTGHGVDLFNDHEVRFEKCLTHKKAQSYTCRTMEKIMALAERFVLRIWRDIL